MVSDDDRQCARDFLEALKALNTKIDAMSERGIEVSFSRQQSFGKLNDNLIACEMKRSNVEFVHP